MASQLTDEDVARIAELARLSVGPEERPAFAEQLGAILEYAASIQRVDTTGVPPHDGAASSRLREDQPAGPADCLDRRAVLEQAPGAAIDAGLFRVPRVL